jgi:hypothetical protein
MSVWTQDIDGSNVVTHDSNFLLLEDIFVDLLFEVLFHSRKGQSSVVLRPSLTGAIMPRIMNVLR